VNFGEALAAKATPPKDPTIPVNLRVPTLAFDDQNIVLVWDKPEKRDDIVDYNVFMNGSKLGGAIANNDLHSPAKKYIDAFYAADKDQFHVRVSIHNFTATDLKPNTNYTFTVRSVFKDGKESPDSNRVSQKTTPTPNVFDITKYGAKAEADKVNTKEIQAAINACSKGGKVMVPAGTWKTGALFLKSDMTLEIALGATILGSENPADYPLEKGYRLYPYSKHQRPPSLLNVLDAKKHKPGAFKNIRIVGQGTIDGNGWKRPEKPTFTDEIGHELPRYIPSKPHKVKNDGILAAAQFELGKKDGLDDVSAYGQRRSSLITMRGVRNVYYAGLTILNPANHGIMNLDCDNVVLNGLTHTTFDANNADGMEYGNSQGGMVFNNFFDTGDDSVNFAAGTGEEAKKQRPQSDVWIFNNYFREGHGAVVAGSHTGAWIEKIFAEDNVINGTDAGLRCKSTAYIGGGGREIVFRDNAIKGIKKQPFIFTLEYHDSSANLEYPKSKQSAVFKNIKVQNVSVEKSSGKEPAIKVKGLPDQGVFHENLTFENVRLREVPPADIDGLRNSIFRNVVFQKVFDDADPWKLGKNEKLEFVNSSENKGKPAAVKSKDTKP
jgi:exo-poly-alpha-galacturonosidase